MSNPQPTHLTLPTDLPTQAAWWCAVNGYANPPGIAEPLTEAEKHEIFEALEAIPGVTEAGLALTRHRWQTACDTTTGEPLTGASRRFWDQCQVASRNVAARQSDG